jgi:hypothetical protein
MSLNFFNTGDVYVGYRQSLTGMLEKANDVNSEWNEIGICISDKDKQGFLIAREGTLKLYTLKEIRKDSLVTMAGIRQLNRSKFGSVNISQMAEYIDRNFGYGGTRFNINVVSRVMQRMTQSNHPHIQAPSYTYSSNGVRTDRRGNGLRIPGYSGNNQTFKAIENITMYELVMAVLASSEVYNLIYNPEIELSAFTIGGSLDKYLENPIIFKQEQFPYDHHDITSKQQETILLIKNSAYREGPMLANLMYESEFYTMSQDYESDSRTNLSNTSNSNSSEEYLEVDKANRNFTRRTRDEIAERKSELHGQKTHDRLIRKRAQEKAYRSEPMKYK